MYKLAVVGNPIAHSLSPIIWTQFGNATGIDLDYQKICAPIDDFEHVVRDFFAGDGYALSVTAPFKQRAYALANLHNPHTLLSQTANHLFKRDGVIVADNTDGIGLVADLNHHCDSLDGKNILLIGSGGVVYSVLSSLVAGGPARLDLLMRDFSKLDDFTLKSPLVDSYDPAIVYDIVINTTPNVPENNLFRQVQHLSPKAIAYDMIYTAKKTLFLQAMKQITADVIQVNGIGMLIEQAVAAFELVFGVWPATAGVKDLYLTLREKLDG